MLKQNYPFSCFKCLDVMFQIRIKKIIALQAHRRLNQSQNIKQTFSNSVAVAGLD